MSTSESINDYAVLEDMRAALRQHLSAALIECAAHARDLQGVDGDQLMTDLRAEFDPALTPSRVQDCFSDGFHAASAQVAQFYVPLSRKALPSGVVL